MSQVNFMYDAANAFRSPGSAVISATSALAEIPLDKLVDVRPGANRNKLGAQGYKIAMHIERIDFVTTATAGDPNAVPPVEPTIAEEYVLTAEVGVAGAPATVVGSLKPTDTGQHVLVLDAQTIEKADPSREVITVRATIVGDAPALKLSAWLL